MNHKSLIHLLVLSQIADDYEDFGRISASVSDLAAKCGVSVLSDETRGVLFDLLNRGLARAYRLSPWQAQAEEVPGVPLLADIDEYYFLLNANGARECQALSPSWPFDEDDNLRADWSLEKG